MFYIALTCYVFALISMLMSLYYERNEDMPKATNNAIWTVVFILLAGI